MALLLQNAIHQYNYINHDLSDERTRDNWFILNPVCMALFSYCYYKLVTSWGPKFMANRTPYELKKVLIIYNIFQIVASASIAIGSIGEVWITGYYSLACQPISRENTLKERRILLYVKIYYLVKLLDLLDTVFFVLRKKSGQVSFLHVYHHIAMIILGFTSLKYIPAGHGAMLGTLNSIVHTFMYTYYLLAALGYGKTISRWKKYITQIQLLQFILLFIHFGQVLFRPSCTYPKWISLAFLPQCVFMIFMFGDFYIKEYIKKKKNVKEKKEDNGCGRLLDSKETDESIKREISPNERSNNFPMDNSHMRKR